jgi:3-phenylpropionate/trans-cinnamate dioxygenase ferredoxin subunit
VCSVEELPPGSRRVVRIDGREIAVINVEGDFVALRNRCAHQGGPLGEGPLTQTVVGSEASGWALELRDGAVIRCPWHGLEYDVTSGRVPCDHRWRVKVYETRVRGGHVEVTV